MTLSIFDRYITQTSSGETVPAALVTIYAEGGSLAPLYLDSGGVTPAGNPVTADSDGRVQVYVEAGKYTAIASFGGDLVSYPDIEIGSSASTTSYDNGILTTTVQDYLDHEYCDSYADARVNLSNGLYESGQMFFIEGYPDPWQVQSGSPESDNGYVLVGGSNWAKYTGVPTAKVFGAVNDYNRSTKTGTDSTDALLTYADWVNDNTAAFILETPASKLEGYYTTQKIDLFDCRKYQSNGCPIIVRSSLFTDDWVLAFGDTSTDASDLNGDLDFDFIDVIDADFRDSVLNGVFLKKTRINGGDIRARRFNGSGISFEPLWDSVIGHLVVEDCGNVSSFAVNAVGNGDETNSVTIGGILSEKSYQKAINWRGSKNSIKRVHCERTQVIVADDGTTGLPSGLTYTGNYFALVGGEHMALDFNGYDSGYSGWNGLCSDGVTPALDLSESIVFQLSDAGLGVVNAPRATVSISEGSSSQYGDIKMISCANLYTDANSRITFSILKTSGIASILSANSVVNGGRISTLGVTNASLQNLDVVNDVTTQATLACRRYNCTFADINAGGSSAYVTYIDCDIENISLSTNSERAVFRECRVSGDVTLSGTKEVELIGGRVDGDYIQTYTAGQNVITSGTGFGGTVSGWNLPDIALRGKRTSRPSPLSGEGVDYVYVGGWRELTSRP